MTNRDTEYWRDPKRVPLEDLTRAMGTYSGEGQTDDVTGGEAGAEEEFGDEAVPAEAHEQTREDQGEPDPDTEEGRRIRPSPHGRIGPA